MKTILDPSNAERYGAVIINAINCIRVERFEELIVLEMNRKRWWGLGTKFDRERAIEYINDYQHAYGSKENYDYQSMRWGDYMTAERLLEASKIGGQIITVEDDEIKTIHRYVK